MVVAKLACLGDDSKIRIGEMDGRMDILHNHSQKLRFFLLQVLKCTPGQICVWIGHKYTLRWLAIGLASNAWTLPQICIFAHTYAQALCTCICKFIHIRGLFQSKTAAPCQISLLWIPSHVGKTYELCKNTNYSRDFLLQTSFLICMHISWKPILCDSSSSSTCHTPTRMIIQRSTTIWNQDKTQLQMTPLNEEKDRRSWNLQHLGSWWNHHMVFGGWHGCWHPCKI